MKAREAAAQATVEMSPDDILALMPEYKHDLPKRQWLVMFLNSVHPDLQDHFSPLKKLAYPKQIS